MELPVTKGVVVLLPPPEGYDVNFEHPQRNGDITCYWLTAVGGLLALLFLGQRLYVKAVLRRRLGIDDGLLVIAWMFSMGIQALIVRGFARKYIGLHVWEMPFTKFQENYFYSVYIHTIVYAPPTALAKMVLLMFYLQLQSPLKWFLWATYATMFISCGASTGIFFASVFACKPIAMGWDLTITNGSCIDRPALYEATAALGVIVDCLIIVIPIPMVLRLQMSRSKKIGLIFMFMLGSVTVITSMVRLALLVTEIKKVDSAWVAGPINYWVTIEANLLIICASLPTVRQFARTVAPDFISSISKSGGYSKSSKNIITIGGTNRSRGSRKRTPYDSDIMMETLVAGGAGAGSTHTRDAEDGNLPGSADGDGHSKAVAHGGIMKTQTAQVTYNTVDGLRGNEANNGRSFV